MAYGYPGPLTSSASRDCSRQGVAATWTTAAWAGVHAAPEMTQHGLQAPQHPADSAGSLRGLFSGMGEAWSSATAERNPRLRGGCHTAATNLGFGYGQVHAAVTWGLAGQLDVEEAEQRIAASVYDPPVRDDATGLLHFARDQLRRSIYSAPIGSPTAPD
jgi:hypothetical protein